MGAVYEVSGGISSYFHLKSVNEDLLDRNMVLEQQITNLEKALREHQVDSVTVNSIKEIPLTDYQLFKAHVIKNSLNQADNYITLDQVLLPASVPKWEWWTETELWVLSMNLLFVFTRDFGIEQQVKY